MDSTRFDSQIQVLAKKLADGDSFLAEELRSEMHIAIMSVSETYDYDYMGVARDTAEAYLKGKGMWEVVHLPVDINVIQQPETCELRLCEPTRCVAQSKGGG